MGPRRFDSQGRLLADHERVSLLLPCGGAGDLVLPVVAADDRAAVQVQPVLERAQSGPGAADLSDAWVVICALWSAVAAAGGGCDSSAGRGDSGVGRGSRDDLGGGCGGRDERCRRRPAPADATECRGGRTAAAVCAGRDGRQRRGGAAVARRARAAVWLSVVVLRRCRVGAATCWPIRRWCVGRCWSPTCRRAV